MQRCLVGLSHPRLLWKLPQLLGQREPGGDLQPTAGVLQKLNERVHAGPGSGQGLTPKFQTDDPESNARKRPLRQCRAHLAALSSPYWTGLPPFDDNSQLGISREMRSEQLGTKHAPAESLSVLRAVCGK